MKQVKNSYVIENVELWTDEKVISQARVVVEEGRLKSLNASAAPANCPVIDGRGYVLLPAGVDAQTHLRVPGQAHKETPRTGLLAALKGGYSAVLTMPNTQPTIDSTAVLEKGRAEVKPFEEEFGVRVFWSAAITRKLNSDEPTDFRSLVDAGVRAFTNDGLGVNSDAVMDGAFEKLGKLGVPLLQHAEIPGHGGSMAPGPAQKKMGAKPYSDEPEWKMVERDIRELRKHPEARYHVLHVSSRKTLDLVRKAKAEGLNVTAEVSPHHLFFNTETINPDNTAFKMNPPIREPSDQEALWLGLSDGTLDFVATDHAPHEEAMKKGSYDSMAFGTLGLETTLPVLIWGLNRGRISRERLVRIFSSRPAEFLKLPQCYGRWAVGETFHAVWVDVKAPEHEYKTGDISSLSKNSCFIGSQLPGQIWGAFHGKDIFTFH